MAAVEEDAKARDWREIEEEDDNMLVKLKRPRLKQDFFDYLQNHTAEIRAIVCRHLSLGHQQCKVSDKSEWLHGDFNTCIPITVTKGREQRLLLRCPFPYMFGGLHGLDEKIRCEAATFAWISSNCPNIPIPHLWGFGLPNGPSFTPIEHLPWYRRAFECLKRWCRSWLSRQQYYAPFVPSQLSSSLSSGYLLVDFIEKKQGRMLSDVWPPDTVQQKRNFYRSLSRVMLDLARCPLAKIGSFTVHNSGEVSLDNRPLTARLPLLECEGIPTDIPRDRCFWTTDSYIRGLLHCHDMKLRHQPNAVRSYYDAEGQMAVLTMMRALPSHFALKDLQHGPFRYIWTDPHASNIFVNQHYEITALPDLEWFCALPIEALFPPFWLSGHAVDELDGENRKDYEEMCIEFMEIFEREDDQHSMLDSGLCKEAMTDVLNKGTHWFWAALNQPRALYNLFLDHIQPQFAPTHLEDEKSIQFQHILAPYWTEDSKGFIDQKLCDRQAYLQDLRSEYGGKAF